MLNDAGHYRDAVVLWEALVASQGSKEYLRVIEEESARKEENNEGPMLE